MSRENRAGRCSDCLAARRPGAEMPVHMARVDQRRGAAAPVLWAGTMSPEPGSKGAGCRVCRKQTVEDSGQGFWLVLEKCNWNWSSSRHGAWTQSDGDRKCNLSSKKRQSHGNYLRVQQTSFQGVSLFCSQVSHSHLVVLTWHSVILWIQPIKPLRY